MHMNASKSLVVVAQHRLAAEFSKFVFSGLCSHGRKF